MTTLLEEAEDEAFRVPFTFERSLGTLIVPPVLRILEEAPPIVIEWLNPVPLLPPVRAIAGIARPRKAPSVTKLAKPPMVVGTSLKSTGAANPRKFTGAKET